MVTKKGEALCHPLFVYNTQENREFVVVMNGSVVIIEDLGWSSEVIAVTPVGAKGPSYGYYFWLSWKLKW